MSPQILAFISWRVDMYREVFGIHYFPHGVLIAIGFLAGSLVLSRYARRHGVAPEVVWDISTCSPGCPRCGATSCPSGRCWTPPLLPWRRGSSSAGPAT